jgi:hypothetical protein
MYVLSGKGPVPKVRQAGSARGGQPMSGTAQQASNKKASDFYGNFRMACACAPACAFFCE